MNAAKSGNDPSETSARVILDVSKAISAHLELTDVLEALIAGLKPTVAFDAVSVVVLDREYARLHSLYIEGLERKSHESVQSILREA